MDSRVHCPPLPVLVPLSPGEVRAGAGSNLLGQLLLGGLLLLLHDLGDGGRRLLSLPLLELADLVAVVSMVRIVGVQKVELGVVDLVLSYPSFKFRSISRRREKDSSPQPLQRLRRRMPPVRALFLPPRITQTRRSLSRAEVLLETPVARPAASCLLQPGPSSPTGSPQPSLSCSSSASLAISKNYLDYCFFLFMRCIYF